MLEFANALWTFLRMQLRHAQLLRNFPAAHGVAEMRRQSSFLSTLPIAAAIPPRPLRYVLCRAAIADQADACTCRSASMAARKSARGANDQQHHVHAFRREGHRIRMSLKARSQQRM